MKHTFKFRSKEEMDIAYGRIKARLAAQAAEHMFDAYSSQCVSLNDLVQYVHESDGFFYDDTLYTHLDCLETLKVSKHKKEITINVFYLIKADD